MTLTEEQHRIRSQGVGGSDANKLMTGDWYDLWAEKLGIKERDDLSDILPVQMGIYTEDFNRNWFEKTTGKLVLTNTETIVSPTFSWMVASLDGWIEEENAVWEAKHVNGFSKPDNVLKKYMPQLQHYMMVTGASKA
jgi:predicted phage-related endonuclease